METDIQHICLSCGYAYELGTESHIPFEQLPDDWECPECGAEKDAFTTATL